LNDWGSRSPEFKSPRPDHLAFKSRLRAAFSVPVPVPVPDGPATAALVGRGQVDVCRRRRKRQRSRRHRRTPAPIDDRRWWLRLRFFWASLSWVGWTLSLRGHRPLRDSAPRRNQRVTVGRSIGDQPTVTDRCFSPRQGLRSCSRPSAAASHCHQRAPDCYADNRATAASTSSSMRPAIHVDRADCSSSTHMMRLLSPSTPRLRSRQTR